MTDARFIPLQAVCIASGLLALALATSAPVAEAGSSVVRPFMTARPDVMAQSKDASASVPRPKAARRPVGDVSLRRRAGESSGKIALLPVAAPVFTRVSMGAVGPLLVEGRSAAGSLVIVRAGTQVLGSAATVQDGSWRLQLGEAMAQALAGGDHDLTLVGVGSGEDRLLSGEGMHVSLPAVVADGNRLRRFGAHTGAAVFRSAADIARNAATANGAAKRRPELALASGNVTAGLSGMEQVVNVARSWLDESQRRYSDTIKRLSVAAPEGVERRSRQVPAATAVRVLPSGTVPTGRDLQQRPVVLAQSGDAGPLDAARQWLDRADRDYKDVMRRLSVGGGKPGGGERDNGRTVTREAPLPGPRDGGGTAARSADRPSPSFPGATFSWDWLSRANKNYQALMRKLSRNGNGEAGKDVAADAARKVDEARRRAAEAARPDARSAGDDAAAERARAALAEEARQRAEAERLALEEQARRRARTESTSQASRDADAARARAEAERKDREEAARRQREEAERLAEARRARAEEEQRRTREEDERRKAEAAAKMEAARRAEAENRRIEEERQAEAKRLAAEKLAEARRLAEQRDAEARQQAADARRAAEQKAAEDARAAAAAVASITEETRRAKEEAQRAEDEKLAMQRSLDDQRRAASDTAAAAERRKVEAQIAEERRRIREQQRLTDTLRRKLAALQEAERRAARDAKRADSAAQRAAKMRAQSEGATTPREKREAERQMNFSVEEAKRSAAAAIDTAKRKIAQGAEEAARIAKGLPRRIAEGDVATSGGPDPVRRKRRARAASRTDGVDGARRRIAHRSVCRLRAGKRVDLPGWYVASDSDTLWRIARVHYGQGREFRQIYQANRDRMSDADVVPPCLQLRLPLPEPAG